MGLGVGLWGKERGRFLHLPTVNWWRQRQQGIYTQIHINRGTQYSHDPVYPIYNCTQFHNSQIYFSFFIAASRSSGGCWGVVGDHLP